jgi:NAD(P)H dehydrogenase (quinone)
MHQGNIRFAGIDRWRAGGIVRGAHRCEIVTSRASVPARARLDRDRATDALARAAAVAVSRTSLHAMPKLLVLFDATDPALTHLADAVAAGARTVRFAEVDVRRAGEVVAGAEDAPRHRVLATSEELAHYDGIVLGIPPFRASGASAAETVLMEFAGSLANRVGSAFTTAEGAWRRETLWRALATMADRGMILVPGPFSEGPADDAGLGVRLAEVVGWVTHARSHHHHHHH